MERVLKCTGALGCLYNALTGVGLVASPFLEGPVIGNPWLGRAAPDFPLDREGYRQRNVERMVGRLKDFRRIAS